MHIRSYLSFMKMCMHIIYIEMSQWLVVDPRTGCFHTLQILVNVA